MDAIKRETMQLWFIAKYYHELSCDIMSDIPEELLNTKVGHFADSGKLFVRFAQLNHMVIA